MIPAETAEAPAPPAPARRRFPRLRLLDRYVLHTFLASTAIFLTAFLTLILVIDFSVRLPRFLALENVATGSFILSYYGSHLPMFLQYILAPIPLFAAMFTMIRLQKHNELIPIVASGMSLRRVGVPFIAAAAAASVALVALDEFVLPPLTETISRTDEILLTQEMSYSLVATDGRGTHLWAEQYNHVRTEMTNIVASRFRPNARHELIVSASRATWNASRRRWTLHGGIILPYDAQGNPVRITVEGQPPQRRVDVIPEAGFTLDSDISPDDFRKTFALSGQFHTLSRLNELIAQNPASPRYRIMRHARFSTPLSSVILLLLGLPFVVAAYGRSFFRGLSLCLIVTAAYYAVHVALLQLGRGNDVPPWAAAWMAPLLFGAAGGIFYGRMKT